MIDVVFRSAKPMLGYGTTEMRCVQPMRFLQEAGFSAHCGCLYDHGIPPCRVLVLHRVLDDGISRRAVALARRYGAGIVYDIDDFITADDDQDAFNPNVAAALARADIVSVSGPELAGRVRAIGKDSVIVANKLSHTLLQQAADPGPKAGDPESVTLGYFSGSAHHDRDFALIAPALISTLDRFPQTRLMLAGKLNTDAAFDAFGDRIIFEPFRPYADFIKLLGQIDINLAPLELGSSLARARSELKYIEAAAFGVPTLASPSPAYAHAIDQGHSGKLVSDDGWEDALAGLVTDPALRQSLGAAARAHVLRDYTPDRGQEDWRALLDRFPTKKARPTGTLLAQSGYFAAVQARRGRNALRRLVSGLKP